MATTNPPSQPTLDQVKSLESDAGRMLKELEGVMGRLKELSQAASSSGPSGQQAVDALTQQLQGLQQGLQSFSASAAPTLAQLDQKVRANPYVFIAGALGLGMLLGKALRS